MGLVGGSVTAAPRQALRMTGLLASVISPDEALLSLDAGADIIDCKNPALGALGALTVPVIRDIVGAVRGRVPVSATVGDLQTDAAALLPAVRRIGATGVDFVKLGFLRSTGISDVIEALAALTPSHPLIAVLFADRCPESDVIPELAAAGFAGIMLDTAIKDGATLLDLLHPDVLRDFVQQAHRHGLLCGLAGSLRANQIATLLPLQPDYLGFRGALCEHGRTSRLSPTACARIRAAIPTKRASEPGSEAA